MVSGSEHKTMATMEEWFVMDAKGKKKGVILTLGQYRRLMEDLHDLAIVAERREEEGISLHEMKHRLMNDGLL
jgi:hypothetical protein